LTTSILSKTPSTAGVIEAPNPIVSEIKTFGGFNTLYPFPALNISTFVIPP
jgi:hypothetical protein